MEQRPSSTTNTLRNLSPSSFVALFLAAYSLAGGLITLVGWYVHAPRLTDWVGSGISMFSNTALAAVLAATALILQVIGGERGIRMSRWPAVIAMGIGAATILEHLSGWNLRIDTLIIDPAWGERAAVSPGRMGPPASVSFACLGLGLVLAAGGSRGRRGAARIAMGVIVLASLSLIGYLFHADPLFGIARFTGIALQTATILLALSASLLASIPEHEPLRTLLMNNGAGVLTRRALPFVITLPVGFAILRTWGEQAGYYDGMMGRSLLVLVLTCVFCTLLWWCAAAVGRHESELEKRSAEIEELNDRLQLAMKETHHRVKNNLQVISAMIDINVLNHDTQVPVDELGKIGQHVRSLAVIHDLLTQQARLRSGSDSVTTKDIMDRLAPLLQAVAGNRRVQFNVEDYPLALRQGTAISVLVNELVSNAVKHGMGDIEVCLSAAADRARLQVSDCGPGFPSGFSPGKAANTGFQLIENVCRFDLQGAPAYGNRSDGGAVVTVEFPWKPVPTNSTQSATAVVNNTACQQDQQIYDAAA